MRRLLLQQFRVGDPVASVVSGLMFGGISSPRDHRGTRQRRGCDGEKFRKSMRRFFGSSLLFKLSINISIYKSVST